MLLREPLKQTGKLYVGVVVDNDDPSRMQRVRVRLPQHPDNLKDENLPWVVPEKSGMFGSGNGLGTMCVPIVGSFVSVRFCPDQYSAVYTQLQTSTSANITEGYPKAYGMQDQNGNFINMNLVEKLLKVLLESEIQVSQTGDLKVKLAGNIHIVCDGMFIQAKDINITSNSISTNASVCAPSIDTYNLVTNALSATAANVNGSFSGSLNGGCSFASVVSEIQGQYPDPNCLTPNVVAPTAPDLDFEE